MKLCQQFVVEVIYKGWKDQMFTAEQIKYLETQIQLSAKNAVAFLTNIDTMPKGLTIDRVEATYNGDTEISR